MSQKNSSAFAARSAQGAFALLLCGSAIVHTSAAYAQDATPADVSADEIVVTAQKRTENVQDVPKSVAVTGQQDLVATGVSQLRELTYASPSVTGSDQGQNGRAPGIRGIVSVANSIGVQSQTGVIVDDVPLPTYSTLANELSDVRRVEVFAGPQATLSGRNAAGGIINIVTRDPEMAASADFTIEQTTDRQTRLTSFVTAPLADTVAVSVSAFYNNWKGNLRNSEIAGRFGGFKSRGVRGKLLFDNDSTFRALLTGYILETDRTQPPFLVGGPYVYAATGNEALLIDRLARPVSSLPYTIDANNRTFSSEQTGTAETRDRGGSLRLELDSGSLGTLTSLTSYSRSSQPRYDVFFGFPQDNVTLAGSDFAATTDVSTKYLTQELRLSSDSSGPVTYLLGAIYTDTDMFQPYRRALLGAINWDRTVRIKSAAVFGRATWNVTDVDALTVGARYQHDKQQYSWLFKNFATNATTGSAAGQSGYGFFAGEASYKHDFSSDVSGYITLSHSETGEAYDLEDSAKALSPTGLTPLDSEKVNNVEFGVKSQMFDRRLTFNMNFFWADYEDYQIQSIDSSDVSAAPVFRLLAIGKVRTKGFELMSSFKATDNLRLGINMTYAGSKIRDYPAAACYLAQSAAEGCVPASTVGGVTTPANQGNLKGLSLPDAPKLKLNASADLTVPLEDQPFDLNFGINYRYQSAVRYDLLGDPLTRQDGFGVANVRVGLAERDDNWSIDLFVNNLFDKNYYTYIRDVRNRFSGNGIVLSSRYDRSSFRYGGVRATVKF